MPIKQQILDKIKILQEEVPCGSNILCLIRRDFYLTVYKELEAESTETVLGLSYGSLFPYNTYKIDHYTIYLTYLDSRAGKEDFMVAKFKPCQ